LQYGAKYVLDHIDNTDYKGYTDLISAEIRRDLNKDWDVGSHASILNSWSSNVHRYALGASIGYRLMENSWLNVGYNLAGFNDGDFSGAEYRVKGPYVSLSIKFDQDTLKLNDQTNKSLMFSTPATTRSTNAIAEPALPKAVCVPPVVPAVVIPVLEKQAVVIPVVEKQPVAQVIERINLSADALFAFDKFSASDLLLKGKKTLDDLADKLKEAAVKVSSIKLTGYTDRLGSDSYNQKLSEKRALTVKQYLQSKGVIDPIEANGRGETDQIVSCGISNKLSKALTDCLQPNRRVLVEIIGVRQH
jgi:outer membrane protein OmpA-like peptidoglycan-associated protein